MGSNGKPIKKRAVAATFLFRFADGSGNQEKAEVALFRRSAQVRTYQHKLAPISGSVEPDDPSPLATAVREIEEETTLKVGSDIELMRKGKSYSFTDDDIGREWTVHPFAFRLKSTEEGGRGEAGVIMDWEHEKWEWHDPHDINDSDDFGGVPRLTDSLRRVWPEYDLGRAAGAVLTAGLEDLRTDHESGARVIATKAVRILRDVITMVSWIRMEVSIWWDNVLPVAWHLCYNGRESMGAAIISSLVTVLARIENLLKADEEDPEKKKHRVILKINEFLLQRESTISRIGAAFIGYIESTVFSEQESRTVLSVLTTSYSSTILSTLLGAAKFLNVDLDVRVLESRPLCEGVTLASKLLEEPDLQERIKVTLYTDASAAIAAQGADVLLLGADRISSEGDVSNKTGTLPVALSTRHVSPATKIIVVSEVEKIAGPGAINDHCVEENSPIELSRIWDDEVKGAAAIRKYAHEEHKDTALSVKNVYFEWLPAQLVDAYITDEGSWSLDDIKARSQKIGEETDKFFSRVWDRVGR
ncbi:hypothetical protein BJ166DRAFT_511727 [Pestalotiopsis sp. NC0098]|nr:hypothetical protein BJ166DRAFT_511727 [Pestalotiopsis sp. NC0098]